MASRHTREASSLSAFDTPERLFKAPTLAKALAVILAQPRPVLKALAACCIERLDEIDGDPDLEVNGDELDGTASEDDPLFRDEDHTRAQGYGAGCPIADPDCAVDDMPCDPDEGV